MYCFMERPKRRHRMSQSMLTDRDSSGETDRPRGGESDPVGSGETDRLVAAKLTGSVAAKLTEYQEAIRLCRHGRNQRK